MHKSFLYVVSLLSFTALCADEAKQEFDSASVKPVVEKQESHSAERQVAFEKADSVVAEGKGFNADQVVDESVAVAQALDADATKKQEPEVQDNQKPQRILLDEIRVRVDGPERSQIFCTSDLRRRNIDSRPQTMATLARDELMYQDAIRHKVPIDDDAVYAQLRKTLSGFGLKAGDEDMIFAQEGYDYKEGFDKFRVTYGANAMISHKVNQGLVITEQEVQAYHDAHPIKIEAAYKIQMAFVQLDTKQGRKMKGLEKDIKRYIKTGKGLHPDWSEPYWLNESDFSSSLNFLTTMKEGDVTKLKSNNGFELYRLVEKNPEHVKPLSKSRYRKIADKLLEPKFTKRFREYTRELFDQANIVDVAANKIVTLDVPEAA